MSKEFVQLEIWDLLEEAKQEPFDVNWNLLWDSLDVSLIVLNSSEQLQVAADALLQMVEVFHLRSMEAFEELEAFTSDDGPVMGDKDCTLFGRPTVDVDFDEFIEPLVSPIRKSYTFTERDEYQSQMEIVDKEILLETIEVSFMLCNATPSCLLPVPRSNTLLPYTLLLLGCTYTMICACINAKNYSSLHE